MLQSAPHPPGRVVLVDDQPLFRQAIAQLLDGQPDFEVVGQAVNGLDGVELTRALVPDIVVLDVEMPVMDGVTAASMIRDQFPQVKIVMLTVDGADDHLLEAVRLGVHGYLLKDLSPQQLFEMLRSVRRDETPVSPALVSRLVAEVRTPHVVPEVPTQPGAALSERELQILTLVADGLSNREIGRRLVITEGTVKNHVHNALHKLGMDNRIQAAAYVVRSGLAHRPS